MRLYELQAGEKKSLVNSNMGLYINTIKTRCSDALTAMQRTNEFLYRGISHSQVANLPDQFKGKSRVDREVSAVNHEHQRLIDNILSEHGFEALRSNSIFCTSYPGQARIYGQLFVIFPVNGFDFTWSPNYHDLFAENSYSYNMSNEDILDLVSKGDFRMNNFGAALKSENEVLIRGEYYAFKAEVYESQFQEILFAPMKDVEDKNAD